MRALVVYESMFGNTRVVAANVADGLRAVCEVTLAPVAGATVDLFASADLLVVGGPTHSGVTLDPDAAGPGVRDLLRHLGAGPALAAAFDTRIDGVPASTGQASRRIARLLKRRGCRIIAAPESFLVTPQSRLADGEAARARLLGRGDWRDRRRFLPPHLGLTAAAVQSADDAVRAARDQCPWPALRLPTDAVARTRCTGTCRLRRRDQP